MPEIGDIARANEIGKNGKVIFVWVSCPRCKEERWVTRVRMQSNTNRLCRPCSICVAKYGFSVTSEKPVWYDKNVR